MRTRSTSTQLILALCSTALLAACGGNDRQSGTKPRPGNNNTNNNTVVDAGTGGGDCSPNPNNCAPNQLIGAPPNCTCLTACATGFTWNPATMVCDAVGGGADAGNNNNNNNNNNPDAGNNNNNPDAGTPPEGACQTSADCTGGQTCIDVTTLGDCAGGTECGCFGTCNANSPNPGCGAGEVCFWGQGAQYDVCIADQGGMAHNQPCQAQFDVGGNLQGDNCAVNHFCWGAQPDAPTGTCARLCPPGPDQVCPALGNFTCDTSVSQDMSIGLCFEPAPAQGDEGRACMSGVDCSISGRCVLELGGLCSGTCDGLTQCASDALCIPFNAPVGNSCVLDCTMGGNSLCEARNANTACHTFSGGQPLGLCFPKCQDNNGCLVQGQTCDPVTGACSG